MIESIIEYLKAQMLNNEFFSGAAIATVLGTLLYQLKALPMDGIFYKNGLITIITTNHIDNLDPALIRSRRIDLKIELSNPDKNQIEEYLKFFYDKKVSFTNGYSSDKSMSDIVEICLKSNDPIKTIKLLK